MVSWRGIMLSRDAKSGKAWPDRASLGRFRAEEGQFVAAGIEEVDGPVGGRHLAGLVHEFDAAVLERSVGRRGRQRP